MNEKTFLYRPRKSVNLDGSSGLDLHEQFDKKRPGCHLVTYNARPTEVQEYLAILESARSNIRADVMGVKNIPLTISMAADLAVIGAIEQVLTHLLDLTYEVPIPHGIETRHWVKIPVDEFFARQKVPKWSDCSMGQSFYPFYKYKSPEVDAEVIGELVTMPGLIRGEHLNFLLMYEAWPHEAHEASY